MTLPSRYLFALPRSKEPPFHRAPAQNNVPPSQWTTSRSVTLSFRVAYTLALPASCKKSSALAYCYPFAKDTPAMSDHHLRFDGVASASHCPFAKDTRATKRPLIRGEVGTLANAFAPAGQLLLYQYIYILIHMTVFLLERPERNGIYICRSLRSYCTYYQAKRLEKCVPTTNSNTEC